MSNKIVSKRFPSEVSKIKATFLSNPKIDGELYAYLQAMSRVRHDEITGEPITYVNKSDLPTQKSIAENILQVTSRHTVANHLKELIKTGYLIDAGKEYILPRQEEFYMLLPLPLLQHLIYTVKTPVIKTLIYLCYCHSRQEISRKMGQSGYAFTIREIADNLGLDYSHYSGAIHSYITILEQLGIVKIARFYEGKFPKMRVIALDFTIPSQLLNKT